MYIYIQSRVVRVREDRSALFYVHCTQPHCLPLGSAPFLPSLAPRGRTQLLSPPCSLPPWEPSQLPQLFLTILVLAGGLKKSFSSWLWPNERNRPLQLLLGEMDRMEAFPGGISDLCSLSFQQAQLLVTTQLGPGHASPCFAAASPEVLHRPGFVFACGERAPAHISWRATSCSPQPPGQLLWLRWSCVVGRRSQAIREADAFTLPALSYLHLCGGFPGRKRTGSLVRRQRECVLKKLE